MSIETRRTCVLAMSRLTEATVDSLFACPLDRWPVMGAPMGPDMLMIWAPTDGGAHDLPDDLRAVLSWARTGLGYVLPGESNEFDYVIFDRDVDPAEDGCDLPLYGEEVPGEVPSEGSILRKLIADAKRYYQKNIYQPEACPDGDMFNDLFALIEGAETDLKAL